MLNRLKAILIDFIQQADLLLLGLCSAATLYGLVLIFSATRYMTPEKGMRRMIIQSAALLLGVGVYIFISMVDLEMIMKKWKWILAFNVVFISLLVTPLGIGAKETGNNAWLKFPGVPFQIGPAEVVKITFVLLLAKQIEWLLEEKHNLKSFSSAFFVAGHTLGLMGLYFAVSKDMGNALVFLFIFLCMAFVAGFALRWFILFFVCGGAAFALAWHFDLIYGYMKNRFLVLFDHEFDPQGAGWQQRRSLMAIGSGGVFGQGYMNGAQTQGGTGSLPEKQTDLIFAVTGEELGMIGCIAVSGGDYLPHSSGGKAGPDAVFPLYLRWHGVHTDLPDDYQHRYVLVCNAHDRDHPALFQLRRLFHRHPLYGYGGRVQYQEAVPGDAPCSPFAAALRAGWTAYLFLKTGNTPSVPIHTGG